MSFDYPNTTSVTNVPDLINYANYLSGGYLGVIILIVVGFVAFLSAKAFSYDRSLGFAGFMVLITAIFMRMMSWISDTILEIVIIMFIGIVLMLIWLRGREERV